jgi:chemotaxis protein CheC
MSFIDKISTLHIDILKEIGNVGAGHAATALSTIMNKKIDMEVPNVQIVTFNEMVEMVGGAEKIVASCYLRLEGDAPSHMFFVLPLEKGDKIIKEMTGISDFSFQKPPYDEMAISAFQELGNILVGSYVTSLSDFTGLHLHPHVPAVCIDMIGAILSYGFIELSQYSDYVIVVETALFEKSDDQVESVDGHFFLFPDHDSFRILFSSLGVALDE